MATRQRVVFLTVFAIAFLTLKTTYANPLKDEHIADQREDVNVTYIAAVLEYEPYNIWNETDGGATVLRTNALNIANYTAQAKSQGADILVTPEYGIQSLDMEKCTCNSNCVCFNGTGDVCEVTDENKMFTYTQYVPNPPDRIAPYTVDMDQRNVEALSLLSEAARDNSIYLVVDLAEVEACSAETIEFSPYPATISETCGCSGYSFYNTQVVFDRYGVVIARYRKQNLFLEDQFTQGSLDDKYALFETDFDVAFSLQICFDAVFEHPGYSNVLKYGLRDVAMSTAWVDELPFALAHAAHGGWARGLGANLLVSGHHRPARGKLGSGIHRYYNNDDPVYTFDKDSGNVLLVSNVTTISESSLFTDPKSKPLQEMMEGIRFSDNGRKLKEELRKQHDTILYKEQLQDKELNKKSRDQRDMNERVDVPETHLILQTDLSSFESVILAPGNNKSIGPVCQGSFCCNLTYSYNGDETYMLLVLNDAIYVGGGRYRIGNQICSVSWCRDEDKTTCSSHLPDIPTLESFGPFTMTGVFDPTRNLVIPEGLTSTYEILSPKDLIFEEDLSTYTYTLRSDVALEDTLIVTLMGRWYENDPEPDV